ncbi:MAG: hypothetical protein R2746_14465 [Acidimicrobiales bacterium]
MADREQDQPIADVVVAVFEPDQVDAVRQELLRQGCPPGAIHVGDDADLRWSLRRADRGDRSLADGPHAGAIIPKESTKAAAIAIPVAAAIGAAICLPFAAFQMGDLNVWLRLFWCAVTGAALGGTIGYIVGTAMASKDQDEPGAAQRGVVVRVDRPSPAVDAALVALEPIRVDAFDADGVVQSRLATEEDRRSGGVVEEVAANVERELEADPSERHR